MMRTHYVKLRGVEFHVVEAGPEHGPTVILLHGVGEFWLAWGDLVLPLAQAGYHGLVPDQRGFNVSGKPKGVVGYILNELSADVIALADHFGAKAFSVVGQGLGATVGWWLATKAPERLDRFVAIDGAHPSFLMDPIQAHLGAARTRRYSKLVKLPFLPELVLSWKLKSAPSKLVSVGKNSWFSSSGKLEHYRAAWARPGAMTGMVNWLRALHLQEFPMPGAKSITIPTLILYGDEDSECSRAFLAASRQLCVRLEARSMAPSGRGIIHERPQILRDAILDYLKAGADLPLAQPA